MKNKQFRLILTPRNNAKINMAIDNAIASSYKENDTPILRFYTWENSFTLGLSQNFEDYTQLKEQYNNNCAKRITGGGVLFHGHDLSYSLTIPSSWFKNLSVKQSYEQICQFLLHFYKELGFNTCFAKDLEQINLSKNEFCQVGFEAYDIIVNNKKIGGNAQKRSKKMIFQHGSIPLIKTQDDDKFGSSLEDFKINLTFKQLEEKLISAFEKCFDAKLVLDELNTIEKEKLNKLLERN
ncbi:MULTISPECIES: lipoate--protein ligase family protein [Arcobacteraceae]|uniref:Ligase n=1 Tax=Poseidonibacter parvus TaxID=1850254 RepID=A0A1P8KKI0_9BACT|nr:MULTISPECIES: ligase [Arcobacteraceae]APW65044.1 ligase [Poseidonibacter parvus]